MKNRLFATICTITSLLAVVLTGSHYIQEPLPRLTSQLKKGLWVSSKTLSSSESKRILDCDIPSRGYRAVEISIQNNTSKPYTIDATHLTPLLIPAKTLAKDVFKRAMPRAIGLKIASLLFWPLAIPSTLDTINTLSTYSTLKQDYLAKELRNEVIPAYASITRIVFVKAGAHPTLPIHFKDQVKGETLTWII